MRETINSLEAKGWERAYLLEVLGLWDVVAKAGINPDDVHAFTFRPDFLDKGKRREYNAAPFSIRQQAGTLWKNCVRLKDGTLKEIPLTRSPKCYSS